MLTLINSVKGIIKKNKNNNNNDTTKCYTLEEYNNLDFRERYRIRNYYPELLRLIPKHLWKKKCGRKPKYKKNF